ncbi:hypothetical protein SAMN05518845_11948 [Variovorax sp. YR750]|uniref:hypothetical protein n=1 Tax=Variovorax sp. YR750 TaxID=1884384 RepID=UPI0008BC8569|nr:hypothetical protein [Variovorax sp. YR750]SEM25887.1 hypothetical protein SAMN05518845_11948 [Variovorax sp. YR750]
MPHLNLPFATETDLTQGHLAALALRYSLPHLHESIRSIQLASDFHVPRTLRRYLFDAIQTSSFEIVSPLDGRPYSAKYSVVLGGDKTTFVFFEGFIVGIGHLARGFPLSALILPAQRLFLKIVDDHWAVRHEHLEQLAEQLHHHPISAPPEPGVALLSGDANFAHHVWNQLPSLQAIVEHCDLSGTVEIINTHEPLGSITQMFPELARFSPRHVPDVFLEQVNATPKLRLPVGSIFIPAKLISRLLVAFNSRAPSEQEIALRLRIAAHRSTILWLSIRTRTRAPTNQAQVLARIGCDYLSRNPDGLIVLDGHSVPEDFIENITHDKPAQRKLVEECSAIAAEVACKIIAQTSRSESVVSAVGISIAQTILLAQQATVYFCHHGTVQHKVGWFSSAPGVVHCNRRTLQVTDLGKYIADQSEVAEIPLYLPHDLVESPTEFESEDAASSADIAENYYVNDIQTASEAVMRLFATIRADAHAVPPAAQPGMARATVIFLVLVALVIGYLNAVANIFA